MTESTVLFMLTNLMVPLLCFGAAFAFFFGVMHPRKLGFLTNPPVAALYFLTATLLLGTTYRHKLFPLLAHPPVIPFLALAAFYIFAISAYFLTRTYFLRPDGFIQSNNAQSFPTLDYRFLFSKSFDILFQQTVVTILAISLAELGLSMPMIMMSFALLFGLTHLLSAAIEGWGWTLFFAAFSVASGVVFPPLILYVHYGFVYAFIIHFFFYAIGGCLIWMRFGGRVKAKQSALR